MLLSRCWRSLPLAGTYGHGTICFSQAAIYGDRLLPCRVSALDEPPPAGYGLPCVGDDVLLDDASAPGVYEVVHVGASTDSAAMCSLRKLRWERPSAWTGGTLKEVPPIWRRLGAGGTDGAIPWRPADMRHTILSTVALGRCKDYGRAEPNVDGDGPEREPAGYHSVQGTECDLTDIQGKGIPQVVYRRHTTDFQWDYQPLVARGREFGRQFAIWRDEYARPDYVVSYRRRRTRAPAALRLAPGGENRGGGD